MVKFPEFDWEDADLVVHPVQAVAVYPGQAGIVFRQQRRSNQEDDEIVTVPHHSVGRLIRRLEAIQKENTIHIEDSEPAELVSIFAGD